ncbi:CCAAT/enhancer-binding protein zeta isoform X1 [Dendrobium catenatum]|uniref:CCAAT-binding factor domain-containing protein n=1 Tax=Dendrobium catenatum TaxID=906689 RepID=A0A2I0VTB3_9ASPA|nr:CCAAT/enhancer-binding protein zeta isoform X1 [Dendrobium catenatum]PKU66643.1 hypothetical protein MA16_Dca022399 [Dendrobium catenatum]
MAPVELMLAAPKPRKSISLSGHWYVDAEELERKLLGVEAKKLPLMRLEELNGLVAKKRETAESLLKQYTMEYEVKKKKSGDLRLLDTTARSGTSVDRISAFTCLVEDNPLANMRALDALLSMVTSKVGKRYAFSGYEALKELFLLRLLPNRKLKCLIQRPLQNLPENKDGYSLLLFWYWEECLKQRFERFVISLEEAVKDVLPSLKDKAMKTVYALLKSKPEQERRLLSSLVNKLGDPERKAASNAGYQLSCLLSEHPNMKAIVINEVDSFLFRPHIGLRAKYYAVNFLSQLLLSQRGDGPKIAKRLVEVYFALFKVLIFESSNGNMHHNQKSHEETGKFGSKGSNCKGRTISSLKSHKKKVSPETHVEMDSRILSALLTGVNRAFPFVSSEEADDILEVQMPILFKLAHSENFNVGVQALMLLYQITMKNQIASDRFYRALYAKLLTPAAISSSKPEMFLGLLVKAMKNDINLRRVSAFSKRLIQVALQRPPQYACGCLFMLSEVLKAKPPLWRVILQRESIDDELEHFEDILEEDQNMPPVENTKLNSSVTQSGKMYDFVDGKEDSNSDMENNLNNGSRAKSASDIAEEGAQSHHKESSLPGGYDPRHREPVYCNADRTGLWELTILASHVHPSVAAMARTLLSGVNIVYNGDPLNDLSLGAFLDKFMEKKPRPNKKAEGIWHGGSQIAPTKKLDTSHHLIGDEILQLAEEEVPPEDVVFHRFYMNRTSSSKKLKAKKKAMADDEDTDLLFDENEEEEEDEIDNMLGAGPLHLEEDEEGEFEYEDLGRVIEEDDEDLLGHGSDAEDEHISFAAASDEEEEEEEEEEEDDDIEIWGADTDEDNADDGDNGNENLSYIGRKKRKAEKKSRPSPFASLEDFEHLMAEDRSKKMDEDSGKKYKSKSEKKRKRKISD